jgi:uroporphyrinogen decarboxylase
MRVEDMTKLLLNTLDKNIEKSELNSNPVWIMRQAGRYLPEYRELRAKARDFMDLANNSELASEITLQPIRRFEQLDAAILFADILHIPYALNESVEFKAGVGPILSTIKTSQDISRLKDNLESDEFHNKLSGVYGTIKTVNSQLQKDKTFIGFCGAPWTVATYMLEGQGSKDYRHAKQMMYNNSSDFEDLIETLVKASVKYLSKQIESGVQVVKIFDSWAGVLTDDQVRKYSFEPMLKIASQVKAKHPNTPVILLPKGVQNHLLKELAEKYNEMFDCLALGQTTNQQWAADNLQQHICLQGNLDPALMICDKNKVYDETAKMVEIFKHGKYIANLGHGVTPDTKIENVQAFLNAVKENS